MGLTEGFNPEEALNEILSIDTLHHVFPLLKNMSFEQAKRIRDITSQRMYEKGEKIWKDFCHKVDDFCEDKSLPSLLGTSERVRNKESVKANIAVYYCLYNNALKSAH
jgi:hypothetical protein